MDSVLTFIHFTKLLIYTDTTLKNILRLYIDLISTKFNCDTYLYYNNSFPFFDMSNNFYLKQINENLPGADHACELLSIAGKIRGDDAYCVGNSDIALNCCSSNRIVTNCEIRALAKLCARNAFSKFIIQDNEFQSNISKVVVILNSWPNDEHRVQALLFAQELKALKKLLTGINGLSNTFSNIVGTSAASKMLSVDYKEIVKAFTPLEDGTPLDADRFNVEIRKLKHIDDACLGDDSLSNFIAQGGTSS